MFFHEVLQQIFLWTVSNNYPLKLRYLPHQLRNDLNHKINTLPIEQSAYCDKSRSPIVLSGAICAEFRTMQSVWNHHIPLRGTLHPESKIFTSTSGHTYDFVSVKMIELGNLVQIDASHIGEAEQRVLGVNGVES